MEAILNKYFAHSHQKVLGTLAAYAGLIYLVKAKLSGPKTPKPETPPTEVPAVSRASGSSKYGFDVPTLENFDEWASKEDNLKKWEEWVTKEDNLEKWLKAE